MNAVGIDVSKGKSMIAVMRPLGEVVAVPFEVGHSAAELDELARFILKIGGETRVIMEYTGSYYEPIAYALHEAGLYVSTVHAQLIHDFGNNTIRKVKTDKADSMKIAAYGLANWNDLPRYAPQEEIRRQLKAFSRQYAKYNKLKTMLKNNFISLTDSTFPGVNELFTSPPRKEDGHEKWLDFAMKFWHAECVCGLSQKAFTERYRKWCCKARYYFSQDKAEEIYAASCGHIGLLPKDETTKLLIQQSIIQLNCICTSLAVIAGKMSSLAALLPEHPVVMSFFGVGDNLGPRIIAEIGDVRRFARKESLVCFAGLEAPPYQSGKFESTDRNISKKGSPHLRKALFQVMDCLIKNAPAEDPIFQFLDRKRAEGKHYYSYMTAGSAKFLRIYYARVKGHLNSLEENI
ncbi:MAG: IS110 family transposase [Eubacteriales bacterium]|nr:IS110 family transposase [Eubacteriales bacterium]